MASSLFMEINMNNNELYHHGILGQRWGHRNGPPYPLDAGDHSASEKKAGWRKSLGKSAGSKSKSEKWFEKSIKAGKGNDNVSPAEKIGREAGTAFSEAAKVARTAKKIKNSGSARESKSMSNDELRRRIKRMELEQRYEDLKSKDVERGRVEASEILESAGSVARIAASAATIYAVIRSIKKR